MSYGCTFPVIYPGYIPSRRSSPPWVKSSISGYGSKPSLGNRRIAGAWMVLPGWWLGHPSEKYEFVNWDDEIPNRWEHAKNGNQTTNQMVNALYGKVTGLDSFFRSNWEPPQGQTALWPVLLAFCQWYVSGLSTNSTQVRNGRWSGGNLPEYGYHMGRSKKHRGYAIRSSNLIDLLNLRTISSCQTRLKCSIACIGFGDNSRPIAALLMEFFTSQASKVCSQMK